MSESKQRWRLVFARDEEARYLSHLDAAHLWERSLRRGRVPVAMSEGFSPHPRLVFGAPLPLGMLAEHDLADLFVSERLTRHDMRLRLERGMPRGYRLIELRDEWVGAPALATELVAADYRLTLLGAEAGRLETAARALLGATALPRERRREKRVTAYDLRPLLLALEVRRPDEAVEGAADEAVERAAIWTRLRHSQDRGSGRPEEVVAAMGDELGLAVLGLDQPEADRPEDGRRESDDGSDLPSPAQAPATHLGLPSGRLLEIVRPIRERLWLAGEAPVDATGLAP